MITSFFKSKPDGGEAKGGRQQQEETKEGSPRKKRKTGNGDNEGEGEASLEARRAALQASSASATFADLEALIEPSWHTVLEAEFSKPYFKTLRKFLIGEASKAKIFPPVSLVFRAFELCPWDNVRVVVLGQDPYHNDGQAEGLCFSVPRGVQVPSSLRNVYKELESDVDGFRRPNHGHLAEWGRQGVLLLNTGLTVRAHQANSHKGKGWQRFTDTVIREVAARKSNVVFLLWGKHAQDKARAIGPNASKHCILKSVHPSGLSAHRGWFGSGHFSKANEYLKQHDVEPIRWDAIC